MYISILGIVGIGLVAWGALEKERLYELPFLMGVMVLTYLVPRLVGASFAADQMPTGAYERVAIMTILCTGAVYVGYKLPRRPTRYLQWTYDKGRLFWAALVLTGIGAVSHILLDQLPPSVWQGQPSGIVVAVLFFTKITYYGLATAVFAYLKTREKRFLLLALLCLFFIFPALVQGLRRVQIAKTAFILGLALWFCWEKIPPRALAIPVLLFAFFLGTSAIGELRGAAADEAGITLRELKSIQWTATIEQKVLSERNSVMVAAHQMALVEEHDRYDLGIFHWNRMVHKYVPNQVFGDSFVNAVFLEVNDESTVVKATDFNEQTYHQYGYRKPLGTTTTGMRDSYGSFGYFGFIKFMLAAAIMKVLYVSARRGSLTHQILYALLLAYALHIASHNTNWFFAEFPHLAIFLLPALWYARSGTRRP